MSEAVQVHERAKLQIFEVTETSSLPVGIDFGVPTLVVSESRPVWFSLLRAGRAWLKPVQFREHDLRAFAERSAQLGMSLEAEVIPGEDSVFGETAAANQAAVYTAQDPDQPKLSQREMEVLQLLSEGWSNQEIGRFSKLSLGTVKFHLAHIFEKLGAANRAEAVRRAAESGLLQF